MFHSGSVNHCINTCMPMHHRKINPDSNSCTQLKSDCSKSANEPRAA